LKNKVILCAAGVVAVNMMASAVYAQKTETMSAEYDFEDRTLTVKAELKEGKKSFLNIIILPDGVEVNEQAIKENDDVILKTVQTDTTGIIMPKIVMPTQTMSKRYVCYLNTDNVDLKYRFSTVTASDLTSITTQINGADEAGIQTIIKNDIAQSGLGGAGDDKADDIARYIYSQKPVAGYSDGEFLNAYMVGEGIAYLESGDVTFEELIEEYAAYLEKDYIAEYNKLSDIERKTLEDMFKINRVTDGFENAFNMNLFLAKYKSSESSIDLGNVVANYFTQNGISMSKFNSITNKLYRDEIFAEMYRNRANMNSVNGIVEVFNTLVDAALAKGSENLGGGGSGGGFGAGGSGGSQGPSMTVEGGFAGSNSAIFNDISGHWAKEQIEKAYKKGIVNGFDNGYFMPDKNITRAEFAKMIAQTLNIKSDGAVNTSFFDVTGNDWYSECVTANVQAGIILGDDNKNFNPQKNITRQDVAVMIARGLAYKGVELNTKSFGFVDEADFSEYALEAINALADAGILNGYDNGTFLPVKTASRAEAVVMMMRMEELINEKNN